MRENRSTWEILGSLLGLVLLIAVLYAAVGYFQTGTSELDEATRLAGRPITLAETLSGETGAAEAVTATVDMTSSAAITGGAVVTAAVDITSSAAITGEAAVTMTAELTATVAPTEVTATAATAMITPTETVTDSVLTTTESPTTTTDVTVTQLTTTTSAVTATTAISEDGAVLTTTAIVTTTNAVTATEDLTTTSELTSTAATTDTPEAPAEVAAIFTKAGCIGCHVITGVPNAVGQIGPNLSNIGVVSATRIEGYTGEEYIRESLLQPNAFIAPECPTGPCLPNLMVQNLGDILTTEEIDAVVAYLLTLDTLQ